MSGKCLSLIFKMLSVVFVITAYITVALKAGIVPTSDQAWGILMIGFFIAVVFGPVDLSLIIANIRGARDGKQNP